MAIVTDQIAHTYDGCSLTVTYDDATYDDVTGSYQIQSVTANNPTGTNGYPPRLITVWADYKNQHLTRDVPAGTSQTLTPTGKRSSGDVTGVGLS
jgi:hypothetical protein